MLFDLSGFSGCGEFPEGIKGPSHGTRANGIAAGLTRHRGGPVDARMIPTMSFGRATASPLLVSRRGSCQTAGERSGPGPMIVRPIAGGVEVLAPAKLNLFLEVLGRRPDGYHEIESLMVAVDLYDTLTFTDDPSGEITPAVRRSELADRGRQPGGQGGRAL